MRRKRLWILAVFLGIAAGSVRPALAQTQTAQQTSSPIASLDLNKLSVDATSWLQGLMRINTTNPPGNELAAAKYVATILEQEGIHAEVYQSAPERGILIARLSSSAVPDPARALLLMAHLDVVGVDRAKWQTDPFGATIEGNYLYGRGTLDDKGMLIAEVAVMVALKRAGVPLGRDVILLANADAEQSGKYGIQFALQNYWEKIAAGYALNEGGQVVVQNGKVQYVGVQAAEKVPVDVTVTATGDSGHASVPVANNAIVHLANALAKIATYQAPAQFTPITESYFEQLSMVVDPDIGKWMRALEMPSRADLAIERISRANPVWDAMIHDTVVPTMVDAGVRANVIPSEATATLNVRLVPGDSIQSVVAKLQTLVADPDIHFQADTSIGQATPASSLESALYKTITQATTEEFPGAPVIPMMSTNATDSAYLRLRNVQAYGVLPFPLTEEDALRVHADNERIPLDSFSKGIEYLYRIVSDFAAAK